MHDADWIFQHQIVHRIYLTMNVLENLCQVCSLEPKKYKCPACEVQTCSVECSKKHKQLYKCIGQVDSTKYIKRTEMNSVTLDRDYNFLQNMSRKITLGKRDVEELVPSSRAKRLRSKKVVAGVEVISAPVGLHRSKVNRSSWNKRKRQFYWTVEWNLMGQDGVVRSHLGYHGDGTVIKDALAEVSDKLGEESLSNCKIYVEKLPSRADRHKLYLVDEKEKLSSVLSGKKVLEFPVFYLIPQGVESVNGFIVEVDSDDSDDSDDGSDSSEDSDDDNDENNEHDSHNDHSDSPPEESSSKAGSTLV